MAPKEKIIFADDFLDNPMVRPQIELMLQEIQDSGHEIIGKAASVKEISHLAQKLQKTNQVPTVAIVDGNMPEKGDGARTAKILRQQFPGIFIIAFSSQYQEFGDRFIPKDTSTEEIITFLTNIEKNSSFC